MNKKLPDDYFLDIPMFDRNESEENAVKTVDQKSSWQKILDFFEERKRKKKELCESIFLEMGLPSDSVYSKLGSYHKDEYFRYLRLFSVKPCFSEDIDGPRYSFLLRRSLGWTKQSKDTAIQLFKKMRHEE